MCLFKNFISRGRLSIILLLLILLRLIPFNFLHYHNGEFAGFKIITLSSSDERAQNLTSNTNACTFHQFLDLINHGFFIDATNEVILPLHFTGKIIVYNNTNAEGHSVYILNKGSPISV